MSSADDPRRVRISVGTVGENFGVVGQVKALNGRVLAETATCPVGCEDAARRDAAELAARHGWEVVS